MIVVVSTSSPVASIAAIADGKIVFERAQEVRHRASEAIYRWFEELAPADLEGVVADLGPGGFTGTRVGIVAAKTLAFALDVSCGGLSAFDLISLGSSAIPGRRGAFLLREGEVTGWPEGAVGYGRDAPMQVVPEARRAIDCLERVRWTTPEALIPDYVLEPSISTPKKPYAGESDDRLG